MTEFRNAYAFIPRKAPDNAVPYPGYADFGLTAATRAQGHAIYAEGTHSGILHATLTLEQATVIGSEQKNNGERPGTILPYTFGGEVAIPATSLKGLIAFWAEAASRSSYRLVNGKTPVTHKGGTAPRKTLSPLAELVPDTLRPGAHFGPVEAMFGFVRQDQRLSDAKAIIKHMDNLIVHFDAMKAENQNKADRNFQGERSKWQRAVANRQADIERAQGIQKELRVRLAALKTAGEIKDTRLVALAGKVRFTRGVLAPGQKDVLDSTVVLKELAGPLKNYPARGRLAARSATPNMYMARVDGQDGFISRAAMAANSDDYQVRGAKAYLHHPKPNGPQAQPWRTQKPERHDNRNLAQTKRQVAVRPIKAGTQFRFSLRFDNLTEAELNLLCFALRPTERFRHKIGMGRAIGLGSVRIDVDALTLIDRNARYRAVDFSASDPFARPTDHNPDAIEKHASAHADWLLGQDPDAMQAITLIGETHNFDDDADAQAALVAEMPVLWVALTQEKYAKLNGPDAALAEDRSFIWFMRNEDPNNEGQRMADITAETDSLPTLSTVWRPGQNAAPNRGRGGRDIGQARRDAPRREYVPKPEPEHIARVGGYPGIIMPLKREGATFRTIEMTDGTQVHVKADLVAKNMDKGGLNPGDKVRFEYESNGQGGFTALWVDK